MPALFINHKPEMLSVEELKYHLNACALNSRKSQNVVYKYLYGYGMAICGRYANNREDAVEILNDGLLKVFKEIHHFKPAYADVISSFKAWVRTIITYTAIDHFRKNRKHKVLTSLDNNTYRLPPVHDDIVEKLAQKEMIRALQDISPAYQDVLKLFAIGGFCHKEIAEKLDISVGTSKSNLSKARKQLQKKLLQQNDYYT
jgi:RNA polymerase sigma-70 factor (ECF subfamily)